MTRAEIDPCLLCFRLAYLEMERRAHYRSQGPSDGFGHILLEPAEPRDPDRLQAEATEYAIRFLKEEDTDSFWIGCSDFRTNKAFCWAIEAARVLASGDEGRETALKLLCMATQEVASVSTQLKTRGNP
jgi:hypothetical protein